MDDTRELYEKEPGLMGQSRANLVRIILRKDAVEAKLRKEVEYLRWVIDLFGITEDDIIIKKNEQVE